VSGDLPGRHPSRPELDRSGLPPVPRLHPVPEPQAHHGISPAAVRRDGDIAGPRSGNEWSSGAGHGVIDRRAKSHADKPEKWAYDAVPG